MNCSMVLWEKNGNQHPWPILPFTIRQSTNQLSWKNNSKHSDISVFPWQEPLCFFFTQGQQCVSAVFGLHKAISLSFCLHPSLAMCVGVLCGGGLAETQRRWNQNGETFPYCIFETDIVICNCCTGRIWILLHSKVKDNHRAIEEKLCQDVLSVSF